MRLYFILPAFALLLIISSATSFVGYKYLSLASEYRERNFVHLNATYGFIDLLQAAPVMRPSDIVAGVTYLDTIAAQSRWCSETLSHFERWVISKVGAGGVLDLCTRDLIKTSEALAIMDEMSRVYELTGNPPRDTFALNLKTRDIATGILGDSLAFDPYVSIIEERIKIVVQSGTAFTVFGLGIAFILIAMDLVKSQRIQKVQTQALQRQTQELTELAAIAERAHDSIVLADREGRITWVNPAFESLTGYSLADVLGQKPGDFLQGPDTDHDTRKSIAAALKEKRTSKCKILNYTKCRKPYWISLSISTLQTDGGDHYGFMSISSDISREVRQHEEIAAAHLEIEHRASHDPLTDLPNRRALDTAIRERKRQNRSTTLVRIDLDHFKYVNDTMGHKAGDFTLQKVAEILKKEVRDDDLPARVGGDEFVLLLAEGKTSDDGKCIAQRLLRKIKSPIRFEGKMIRIGASFGVASTLDGLLTIEELIVGADAALYEAKENGRNCTYVYTPRLHTEIADRRKLARELKRAVAGDEFVPFFQPQVDAKTRRVVGVEALVRWRSSALGLLMPDDFLPVAERLSIVEEIDDCIFRKAISEITALQAEGQHVPKLALNVTARRISDPSFAQLIRDTRTGTLTIAFEILESVLVEHQNESFQFGLDSLRDAGVSIEVDDFGSGHASIVGLMQLQPDAMKIERRLVQSIDGNDVTRTVVQNIVNIAKSMNLFVIAEGVETLEQADVLTSLGCDALQGFAFAKPMPVTDLKKFLEERANPDAA